jgi:hypothetical protein
VLDGIVIDRLWNGLAAGVALPATDLPEGAHPK